MLLLLRGTMHKVIAATFIISLPELQPQQSIFKLFVGIRSADDGVTWDTRTRTNCSQDEIEFHEYELLSRWNRVPRVRTALKMKSSSTSTNCSQDEVEFHEYELLSRWNRVPRVRTALKMKSSSTSTNCSQDEIEFHEYELLSRWNRVPRVRTALKMKSSSTSIRTDVLVLRY
jgi:hypothetical protein